MDFTSYLQKQPSPIAGAPAPSKFANYLTADAPPPPLLPGPPIVTPAAPAPPRPVVDPRAAALGGLGAGPPIAPPALTPAAAPAPPPARLPMPIPRPPVPAPAGPTASPAPAPGLTPSQRFAIYAKGQQDLRAGAEAQKKAARAQTENK